MATGAALMLAAVGCSGDQGSVETAQSAINNDLEFVVPAEKRSEFHVTAPQDGKFVVTVTMADRLDSEGEHAVGSFGPGYLDVDYPGVAVSSCQWGDEFLSDQEEPFSNHRPAVRCANGMRPVHAQVSARGKFVSDEAKFEMWAEASQEQTLVVFRAGAYRPAKVKVAFVPGGLLRSRPLKSEETIEGHFGAERLPSIPKKPYTVAFPFSVPRAEQAIVSLTPTKPNPKYSYALRRKGSKAEWTDEAINDGSAGGRCRLQPGDYELLLGTLHAGAEAHADFLLKAVRNRSDVLSDDNICTGPSCSYCPLLDDK